MGWVTLLPFEEQKEGTIRFGFSLTCGRNKEDFYTKSQEELDKWLDALESICILRDMVDDFAIIRQIGQGGQSQVFLAQNLNSGELVAVKHFDKQRFLNHPRRIQSLANEIETLRTLEHSRVLKLYRVYESRQAVDLVTEFIPGETLFDSLSSQGFFSPSEFDRFIQNFLELLAYLSSQNVLHRDLKPENIMVPDPSARGDFKLIDFGFATKWTGQAIQESCGSLGYMAPEIVCSHPYGQTVDVYSAGMIFYVVAVGYSPFYATSKKEVLRLNAKNHISFDRSWETVDCKVSRLIKGMTSTWPSQRKGAKELRTEFMES